METPLDQLLARTTDWDGYVREAALWKLRQLAAPEALPAVFVRLNDWVREVRQAARETLDQLLIPADEAVVIGDLARWVVDFNRTGTPLDPAQRQRLQSLAGAFGPYLDDPLLPLLAFALRTNGLLAPPAHPIS
ncbi:MAG TPA: HEAT repeat domain-containing protein [Herpetosiphonaceae bacterium]